MMPMSPVSRKGTLSPQEAPYNSKNKIGQGHAKEKERNDRPQVPRAGLIQAKRKISQYKPQQL